jgi:hypothetical protein
MRFVSLHRKNSIEAQWKVLAPLQEVKREGEAVKRHFGEAFTGASAI